MDDTFREYIKKSTILIDERSNEEVVLIDYRREEELNCWVVLVSNLAGKQYETYFDNFKIKQ